MITHNKRLAASAAALTAVIALAGCSSAGSPSGAGSPASTYDCAAPNTDTVTDVSIAATTALSTGALYAGIEQGLFEKHGINLNVEIVSTLPALIQAVQGGSSEFALSGTISLLQALQGNIPVQIIAPYAGIAPGYWDKMQAGEEGYTTEVTALVTMANGGVDDPGDLSGKTVAVNDVQGQSELVTRSVIDSHGGDASSVEYVVLSPADAYNALLAGKVDAAYSIVPIVLSAEEDGAQIISWPSVETLKEGPTSMVLTSNEFAEASPDVVQRMNCAVREATAYATSNPDAVREASAEAQGVDPSTYESAVVPYFYSDLDVAGVTRFEKLMTDYGFLTVDVDVESFINPVALK